MSRARLEERTGEVVHHGHALLRGYTHNFDHRGKDGTGKGNIEETTGSLVRGVLYQLNGEQQALLEPFESGYQCRMVHIEVAASGKSLSAYTYVSETKVAGLFPIAQYLQHYMQGMEENGFPLTYIEVIRKQAQA